MGVGWFGGFGYRVASGFYRSWVAPNSAKLIRVVRLGSKGWVDRSNSEAENVMKRTSVQCIQSLVYFRRQLGK